jgi:hypothetical protein
LKDRINELEATVSDLTVDVKVNDKMLAKSFGHSDAEPMDALERRMAANGPYVTKVIPQFKSIRGASDA